MAAKSDDPQGVLIKGAAALTISRNTSLPVSYCLSNLDEISKAQVGTPAQSEQAWLASIVNSYKIGDLTIQRGNIGRQYANAAHSGQDVTELTKQMQDIDAQIESLKDYAPRTWVTKALQFVSSNIPYMTSVGTASAVAGKAAEVVTGIIPGIADDVAVKAIKWITGVAGAMKTKDVLWGSMYYDMTNEGVDENVAYWMSKASGYLSGAIEMALGSTIKGITKAVGVSGGSIADKLISRMYANGSLGKVGAFFTRWIANGVEEGSEEFVESIKDQIMENWAYTLSDIDVPDSKKAFSKETLGSAAEEFIWGAASGMILGLPADIINTNADAKAAAQESERLKTQAAAIPSKDAYVNLNKDTSVLSYMNEAERKQTLADIWEKQQAAQAASSSEDTSELKTIDIDDIDQPDNIGEESQDGQVVEGIASSLPTKPIQRLSDGRLRTQESDTYRTNTDGSETHTLKLGSVGTSQRYGTVDYTINGNEITIDSIKTKQGYEEIVADAVTELSRRYEGYNLSWDPETIAQQKVKADLTEANPRGKEFGLNYYDKITDTDAAIRLANGIRKTFPKLSKDEATVAGQILELVAKSQGKTTAQWMTDNFQGFQQKDLGEGKKGAVEFVETEKGARALVYASENADFSTFAHEVFHVVRRTTDQSQSLASAMQEASKTAEFKQYIKEHEQIIHMSAEEAVEALKKFSDSWTVPQEELAATLFESYLRDGATASPKLRNLFQKIADWFVRIYNKIKSTVKMDDRIVSVFDQILGGDTEVSRQFKEATQEADSINEKVDDINGKADDTLYQSEDAAQQEYDQVYEQYHGTDKWLKAPNGEDTRLTERQWVQVRTPAFIKWFGDWQNDPKNASKIVDENGEPKAMYHGSSFENITEFKNGDRGIIYLTDDPGVAQDYADGKITSQEGSGNKVYELFAKIVNPATSHDKGVIDILYKRWKQNGDTRESIIEAFDEGYDPYLLLEDPGVIQSLKKAGYDGVEFYESASMSYGVFLPAQIKSATDNIGTFDGENPNILFQEAPPDYQPKSTGIGYKVFVQKDGKLYPPMVANPNGEGTPVGKWLLADEAPIAAYSKTGRPQVKSGGKGTQGKSGLLAYRPGWHLGEIPYAKQFNRLNPATGIKELFPKDFVWAEVEYSKDNDYNDEARQNGVSKNGGFNHALASLYRMPTDGFYNYRTNPDPTTDPWVITGAMKVNKILTREEVENLVRNAGRNPQKVEGDNILFQEDGKPQISNDYPARPTIDPKNWDFKKTSEQMSEWKNQLREWVEKQGDLLQFGDESLVHVVHKNVIPDELPWRSTTFINGEQGWVPFGHADYDTKYKAVLDNVGGKAYRPDILFQESNETRPIEKRVRGDKLLDALDLIDEVKQVGATVSDLGIITLYHATSKAAAKNIESTGMMIAKEDGLFFSTKSDGQIAGYGESVVKLEIPAELLEIDDIFDDEAHLYLGIGNKRSRNVAEFGPNILFQTVYHGSGADFAKFNLDFAGTGEGGEMFGWGVYTSESMKIAEEYAKQFGYNEEDRQSDIEYNTKRIKAIEKDLAKAKEDRSNPEWVKSIADKYNNAYEKGRFSDRPWNQIYKGKTPEEIRDIKISNALELPVKELENGLERAKAQLKEIEGKEVGGKHVYTLDIPEGRYLNWDAKVPQSTLNRISKLLKLDEYDHEDLLSYYNIGSDLYNFLAKYLGSSKKASQFLNGIGFDGITYKAGRYQGLPDGVSSKTENKVIFNPESITILENTLFQTTDPEQEIIDEAKGFEDLDDFVSYAEAMLDIDEITAKQAFEKAHEEKGFGENLSDEDKDDKFIQMMETDKGIDEFVSNIRALSYGKWAVDSGQVRGLEESDVKYYEASRRFTTEASPFIQAIAKGTKDVSEESKKKIRSMLINNVRMYRDLYAAIINDDTMAAVQYDDFLPNIDEPAVSGLSIMDRKRMS
ncbi:MAG: hypothetical protein WCR70_07475, partial [Sphaerochaetaceae bacterium]